VSYIRRAGFLPLSQLVTGNMPMMDATALMALVDRWRPETHTFHLPSGEITPWGLLSAFDPPMFPQTKRIRNRQVSTPGGSQLTSTPVRRVLRMESFRGMLGLLFANLFSCIRHMDNE
jgi:hypothetical protein